MFEKFTERARKVMSYSRQESQRLLGEFIGTEHILLGIAMEGGGVAAKVLKNLNIDLKKIVIEVERLVKAPSTPPNILGQMPFSPRAKRVIELAGEAASQLGHDVIGTEHLLLGLLKENEGIAAQILINLGMKLDEVRDMVLEVLGDDVDPPEPAESKAVQVTKADLQGSSAALVAQTVKVGTAVDSTSALSSQDKAEMVVAAWLAHATQESFPNGIDHLKKLIAFAIEASRRGA